MDKKRMKRSKAGGGDEEGMWDCSVCTYKNSAEAFKCAMCDVRKGTSTRKPKPNPQQLVAQQVAQQQQLAAATVAASAAKKDRLHSGTTSKRNSTATSNAGDSTAGETDTSMDSTDAAVAIAHKNSRSLTPPTSAGHPSRSNAHPLPLSTSTPSTVSQLGRSKGDVGRKTQKVHSGATSSAAAGGSSGTGKRTTSTAGLSLEVTVGDLTVVITDYKPKKVKEYSTDNSQSQPQDQLVGGVKEETSNGSLVNHHNTSGSADECDIVCRPAPTDSSSNNESSPSTANISSSSVASSDCDTTPVGGKTTD